MSANISSLYSSRRTLEDVDEPLIDRLDELLSQILASEDIHGVLSRLEGDDPLLTTEEAAGRLRTTKRALEAHRYRGTGPCYIKAGQRVLYRLSDIRRWLHENTVESTADHSAAQ